MKQADLASNTSLGTPLPAPALLMLAVSSLGLAACVTINIYFPAAAAEKAADRIIDEVYQLRSGAAAKPASPPPAAETKPAEK